MTMSATSVEDSPKSTAVSLKQFDDVPPWEGYKLPQATKSLRSVKFNDGSLSVVHEIDSREYESSVDIWYTEEEFKGLQDESKAGGFHDFSNSRHRRSSYVSVIREQCRQKCRGHHDPENLADVYVAAGSFHAAKEALLRGTCHAEEACADDKA